MRVAQGYDNLLETSWQSYTEETMFTVDKENLEDGYAPIYVQIKDSEGNESGIISHRVPYDSPKIEVSIEDGTVYKDPTENLNYEVTFTDNCRISGYEIYFDDEIQFSGNFSDNDYPRSWITVGTTTSDGGYYPKLGLPYMSSGEHKISCKVWDGAGNITTKEVSFTIERSNKENYEGITYDKTTGEFLKDDKTVYLWHLNDSGAEVNNPNATIGSYTNAIGGIGEECASYIHTSGTIPLDVSNNAFTIEYWIKGSEKYEKPYLYVGKSNSFSNNSGYVYLYYEATDSLTNEYFRYQQIPNDGEWHYSTLVYCKDYVARYIDGVLVNYDDTIDIELNNSDSELYMYLDYSDAVDEIRISNQARSADEIAEYYKAAKEIIE